VRMKGENNVEFAGKTAVYSTLRMIPHSASKVKRPSW
jgi:hypothetical protein